MFIHVKYTHKQTLHSVLTKKTLFKFIQAEHKDSCIHRIQEMRYG